ncbi:MAG: chorismate-binding protein [Actinobacteria bacterium]|nr:chorismate-binding protein [Actinomycetota bacterium]
MLTQQEFRALARRFRVVPVTRTLLADLTTPVAAFARWCGPDVDGDGTRGRHGFLLESVDHGGRWSRWSFVGRDPRTRLVARGRHVELIGDLPAGLDADAMPTDAGILAALDVLLDHLRAPTAEDLAAFTSGAAPELPPLHSGVVGYLGYDVVREVEHLPELPDDDRGWPDAVLSVIGELAAYDHWSQQVTLVANAFVAEGATDAELDAAYEEAVARLERMTSDGATPIDEPLVEPPSRTDESVEVVSSMAGGDYERAVEVAKEHILAGDIFQVVLAQRFDFTTSAEPLDIYRTLRQVNPSPYMFLLREDELTLVGCSPEPMVQLLDGRVISRPIAGTRFRGRTDEHDRLLAAELLEHPKERAEHVMLVDLARNDVGRVVEYGTCQVDELMTLERYSHVMHLTSQVSGRLAQGRSATDVLRATLPAGTVSGAPKVRAMEIIDELEPTKRGPYAGIVGYVDFSGDIDTAIAIRTMLVEPPGPDGRRRASVQAGAGVVADSVAADEELETRNKAKALLSAVPAAERMTAQRRRGSM